VNYLDSDRHLIRHRDDYTCCGRRRNCGWEKGERLRASYRPRSGWSHANDLAWRGMLSLLRGTGLLR
jgi:hypothetical protein